MTLNRDRLRFEIRVVIGDEIVTTDVAILDALRRAHDGEEPIDLLDELRAGSDEDDDPG